MGFPEQLKKARLNMNYTQQQVADMMKIAKSTYCGYETGKRQPDVIKIKQLASILNTSGDILLETGFDKTNTNDSKTDFEERSNPLDTEILKLYSSLSDENKKYLYGYMQRLVEEQQDYVNAADISKNEDDYIPLTQARLAAIRRSLPKTPEELERQFPPVEFKRKKSNAR